MNKVPDDIVSLQANADDPENPAESVELGCSDPSGIAKMSAASKQSAEERFVFACKGETHMTVNVRAETT
jgi:hypothetical protein